MSLIGAIKSFLGVQEAKTEDSKKETQTRASADTSTGKIGTMLATGQVSESEAHSGQNGQSTNTGAGDRYTAAPVKDVEIDVKKMAKTYKKNPQDALNDKTINREYNAQEAAELKELLKDKEDLKNYFELAKNGTLTNKDIVAGLKKLTENKTSYLWGLFKGNKLNEEKFASNMSRVRKIRKDFSSEGTVRVSEVITKNEEYTDTAVHMMAKKETYSEANVVDGVNHMEKNPKEAEGFLNKLVEMEEIRTDNGAIKYSGDTILKVTKARSSNAKISNVLLKAAQRKDMSDEPLTKITDNVEHTPEMAVSMEKFIDQKDENGNYRFSAYNLTAQSDYMRGKNTEQIQAYTKNTMELAQYPKMSGDSVVECAKNITDYPKTRESVLDAAANEKLSENQVVSMSRSMTRPEEANISESTYDYASYIAETVQGDTQFAKTATSPIQNYAETLEIKIFSTNQTAKTQDKNVFGSEKDFEYIAEQVKKNPELKGVIEKLYFNPNMPANKIASVIRQYSPQMLEIYATNPVYYDKNPKMLELMVKNKNFFDKLSVYNLTTAQKEQLAEFANGSEKDVLFEMLDNGVSPDKAAMYLTTAKRENKENELSSLMSDNTLNSTERFEKLRNKEFTSSKA